MLADLHSHILHDIDDGPKTLEDSLLLLECAYKNGITRIVATPHFYGIRHGLEERTKKANVQYDELSAAIIGRGMDIELILGYELRYFNGISRSDSIDALCINGTKVLLLELEPIEITEAVINEILELGYCGYTVVLAHIERYVKFKGFNSIKKLIKNQQALGQVNAASFVSGPFARAAIRLLNDGCVSVLSSDMHSVDERPPLMQEAYQIIEKRIGKTNKDIILNRTNRLFDQIKSQEN